MDKSLGCRYRAVSGQCTWLFFFFSVKFDPHCRCNLWNPSACIFFFGSDRSRLMSPQLACRHTQTINSLPFLSLSSRLLPSLTLHFPLSFRAASSLPAHSLDAKNRRALSHPERHIHRVFVSKHALVLSCPVCAYD